MKRYKAKFEDVNLLNRWKQKKYSRNGDWTLIGISRWASSYENYSYKLCFFGFEVHVWFKKIFYESTVSEVRECATCKFLLPKQRCSHPQGCEGDYELWEHSKPKR